MSAKANTTMTTSFVNVKAREVDFVSRFSDSWKSLQEILGIMNPVEKAPGSTLRSYTAEVTLGTSPNEGEEIPYSETTVTEVAHSELTLEKYAKAVTVESVNKYGAAIAVQKTDAAFLKELQGNVVDKFYTFLGTGSLTDTAETFQMGVALAIGKCVDKFKKLRLDATDPIVFVNTLDAYRYLGAANLTVQTASGFTYIENFMGAKAMILSSEIASGKIYATPASNIVLYYVNPSNGDFAQLGLDYTVDGETPFIGFHANGNYGTAVGESFALLGMTLWAEYLNGVANITVS